MRAVVLQSVRCLLVLACAGGLAAQGVDEDEPLRRVRLQLPFSHQFQFAGLYAAQARGLFREQGLEVEIIPTRQSGATPLAEVLAGRAEFGILQGPHLVSARVAGEPVVVLAAIMQHSPQVLLALAESGIRTPHDLVGRRVALDQTSLVSEVRMMLEREGIAFDRIQLVENVWNHDELLAGDADAMSAFVIDGPYEYRRAGRPINIIRPVDYGVDFYGDCLFTTEALLAADRRLVEAMRAAVLAGWGHALREPREIIDWMLEHLPDRPAHVDREMLLQEAREVARLVNADLVELGHVNPGRWRAMAVALGPDWSAAQLQRLDGLLYESTPRVPAYVRWISLSLLAALVVFLLALGLIRRLRRLVQERTAELAAKEEHYRLLFKHSPVALVEFDYRALRGWFAELRSQGVKDLAAHFAAEPAARARALELSPLQEANDAAVQAVGAESRAEMFARLPEIILPPTIEMRLQIMARVWQGLDRAEGVIPYRHLRSGETRYFALHWRMPRLPDGSLSFGSALTALLDITETRAAEQALRESEERYRRLFEATPVPMWIYDLETLRFLTVNDAAVQAYGYSRAEFEGMSILDIRPTEERARLEDVIRSYREGEAHRNGIWRHQRKDGSILLVEVYAHRVSVRGRNGVLVVPFDLTAKLKAEQALRESEARYRELFESAAGGVYRSSPEGRFITVNPALAQMLGFATPEELMARYGDRLATELYVQPGRREEFVELISTRGTVTNFESEVRGRDGQSRWIAENVRAVRDAQGQLRYYEGFVSDVTARRRLEEELQRASKLEAIGILAGGIAHDFNNILTVVLGNITLAEMDTEPAGSAAAQLREAKRATLRARDLTQQLLTFAKGGDPVLRAVDLAELVREAAGFALHGAKARAEFDLPPDLWPANADKGQLGQVVQNLVINSVQAMPDGGIVRISAANHPLAVGPGPGGLPAGRYVGFTVADQGVGIAPEHLTKVFDPYFTTKQQGSGLGLATVYSIIRKHQGHIEVESQLGTGTCFRLWLPAATAAPSPEANRPGTASPFPIRVLFMDDEPTIRQMAGLFFERLGATGEMAADGTEALAKYRKAKEAGQAFDVVIMDLTVPGGMGGREAMERLRAYDPEVKAIVSSGYSRDPVLANYRLHGFQGILPKPYGLAQLRRALRDIVPLPPEPED